MEWKKMLHNEILDSDDDSFFISYNPNTTADHVGGMLTDIGNTIAEKAGLEHRFEDGEETALVFNDKALSPRSSGKTFWILKGDFRKEYEELVSKGLEACKEFFMGNEHLASSWSEHKDIV